MNIQKTSPPLLPEILSLHGKWRARQPALVCNDVQWTWAELIEASHRFAHGLIAHGIRRGDRIGVVMSNGATMVQALLGTMAAGAVSVPINLSVSDEALVKMMHDAEVRAIVVTGDQQARIDVLRRQMPPATAMFISEGVGDGWTTIEQLCVDRPTSLPEVGLADDDLLNIIYSSGTTGMPKGIAHTHRARRDWAYDLTIALRYHGAVRTLLTIGLYSNISWVGMLCTLLSGGTLVVHQRFDAAAFLDTVESDRITHTAMVPVQYQRVADEQERLPRNLGSMQAMMCCGSPLHPQLKQTIFKQFPCGVIELYGLTEGIITTLEPEAAEGRWASVGKPLVGTDIAIIDDRGGFLPPNASGEIISRGRISMQGYFQNPEATLDSQYTDPDGRAWLRSGDIGYLDPEGYLYIVDRKKDMILSGGQNIYPQDIEAVLLTHPAVYDAAVIGVKSRRWGETPLALVVRTEGHSVEEAVLLDWANQRLGKQQRLADLKFTSTLPRNPNGKLLKRELRNEFEDVIYE
ncbi:class I adenylate-forming enzyme family protein [Gilvimarinus sp. F26214L]|uniref:class I adenylate-forming enzyme family protein n=1 Tax=Gilvimarinus sp. DZF01 TaxID=3461371 RepID=UPI00404652F6